MIIILVLWEHPLGDKWDVVVRKVDAFDAEAILRNNMLMFEEVKTSLDWATTNIFAPLHPNLGIWQKTLTIERDILGLRQKDQPSCFPVFQAWKENKEFIARLSI